MEGQCCKSVWSGFHASRCTRKAKVERDGKAYCGFHDPVRKAERDAARSAKWDAEWERKQASWKWEKAALALCSGVDTQTMERLGAGWLEATLKAQRGE